MSEATELLAGHLGITTQQLAKHRKHIGGALIYLIDGWYYAIITGMSHLPKFRKGKWQPVCERHDKKVWRAPK